MRLVSILLALQFAVSMLGQSTGNKAIVVPDTLPLHEEMSADSRVVGELHRGDLVTIRSTIAQSGGTWCSVFQAGPAGKSGKVPCASLRWAPVAPLAPSTRSASRTAPLLPTTRAAHIPQPIRSTIYLVPLGTFRYIDLPTLVEYYRQKFSLEVRILPAIPLDSASYDPIRKQYIAERLMELMNRSVPPAVNNLSAAFIGITEEDIYLTTEDWAWALGFRFGGLGKGVISSARMDLRHFAYNTPLDFNLLHRNLAKMTSRYVGFLYYGLGISDDQRSVVREDMYSIEALQAVGEEF